MNRFTLAAMTTVMRAEEDDGFSAALASGFDSDNDDHMAPYAEQPPTEAEQTEAEQTEAEQTEAEQTEAEQTEAEQTEAEQTEAEQTGDEPPADEPPADEPPTGDPLAPKGDNAPLTPQELRDLLRSAAAPQQADPPAQEPPQASKEPQLDDFLTDEEKQYLSTYDAEWGEVSKAEQIRTRATVQLALAQAKKEWGEALAPIVQVVQQSQATSFRSTVLSAHPDVDQVAPAVQVWIEQQPAILRAAYERVYTAGSAAEVVQLLDVYKQATGAGAAPTQQPASTSTPRVGQQQQRQQERAAKAAQAAKATAAVTNSQRGNAAAVADPDDFASAFDEAIRN